MTRSNKLVERRFDNKNTSKLILIFFVFIATVPSLSIAYNFAVADRIMRLFSLRGWIRH
jgi:hypothetical protein